MLKIEKLISDYQAAQDQVAALGPQFDQGIGAPAHVIVMPNATHVEISDGSNVITLSYSQCQFLKAWLNDYFSDVV